jgi:glycosyltransferase involved in cell wall biosynthesis
MVWGVVPGGTLSVLRDWVPRLAEHGEVSIVSLGPNRASLGVPTAALGTRWSHPFRFPHVIGYVARMALAAMRQASRGRAVLVPQDALATGAAAVIAGLVTGARVVVMEHGSAAAIETDHFWRERSSRGLIAALRQRLLRAALRALHRLVLWRMDVAIVAGDEEARAYLARGVASDRLLRYRFGVDLDLFHPASKAERTGARLRWGVAGPRSVILTAGRLAPEKGVADLVAAIAGLPVEVTPRLVVAGDGPARAELEGAAAAAGIDAIFVGALDAADVASIMHAADCFAYASLRGANTPFAVLEAMASGLPIVATAAPTVHRAMLADGRGTTVAPGDRAALRSGLLAYLQDPAAATEAGAAARRYVVGHHSPSEVDAAVDALMHRLRQSP